MGDWGQRTLSTFSPDLRPLVELSDWPLWVLFEIVQEFHAVFLLPLPFQHIEGTFRVLKAFKLLSVRVSQLSLLPPFAFSLKTRI